MKSRLFIIVLLFFSHQLLGDSFQHINIQDGLSSRRVYQIEQDSSGFMWFFTYTGIDRYDGTEIKHYKLSDITKAEDNLLPATNMVQDRSKTIWIALKNGKIFRYDKEIDNFSLQINLEDYLPVNTNITLNNILFDKNNNLWLCLSSGLYNFSLKHNKLVLISEFNNEQVAAITQVNEQLFFVGTYQHVYFLKKENNNSFSIAKNDALLNVKARVETLFFHQNKLYIGTFSSGAFLFDLDKNETISLNHFIPQVPIRVITSNNDNNVLIGTDGDGIFNVNSQTNQLIKQYFANEDENTSLNGNTVCDIFVDGNNSIWIGTSTNGISILDSRYPFISITKHEYRNNNSLINNHVNIILEDSDGDLWYGTNNGISVYSAKTNQWRHFLDSKTGIKTSPVVLALFEDEDKNIWAGGYGIGIYCINKHTNNISELKIKKDDEQAGIASNYIYSIYANKDQIWFGGIEGDLTQYNTTSKEYRYFPANCIGDIKTDKENNLFLATCDGLGILDSKNDKIEWIRKFNGNSFSTPIWCLSFASDNNIWMASDGEGLISFDIKTGNSEFLKLKDGESSNSILNIIKDDNGRIWFTSERALYCFDPVKQSITNMNEYIGIENNIYNPNASFKRRNGNLVIGTAAGAIEFAPNQFRTENDSVELIFTDFKLFYKSVKINEPGSPLKKAINETAEISLKYTQNSFSFSVSSINFGLQNFIQYLCKLEGLEKEWHTVPQDKNVNYTSIGSGSYIFKVKAINRYTNEILDEKKIEIHIGRPFWASDWAFMVYLGIIVVIVLFFIQFNKVKMDKQNSKEKISFFINMAHDIRTPISLIKAPLSDIVENESLSERGKENLTLAMKNTENFISMVNQLLDLEKADLSTEQLMLTQNELISYVTEKTEGFKILASQKQIKLELITTIKNLNVYFDQNKMDKIINNLLSNSINYTLPGGSVTIWIKSDKNNWILELTDTGIGIPEVEQKNIFKNFYRAGNAINSKETGTGIGLLLTKKLVEMHDGNIQFSSIENEGSTFILTFPYNLSKHKAQQKKEVNPQNNSQDISSEELTKEKLLLVEDNDDMRDYLFNSLSDQYKVYIAVDGQQALEQVDKINPDIIISDVMMPNLNGEEMCRLLKSSVETSHIPIILLTALNTKENIVRALNYGADDYVTKPFDPSVLKARISSILKNRDNLRKKLLGEDIKAENLDYSNQLDKEFMNKAINIIEKELSNPDFTINDYCQELGMSRSSVYNKIKILTGQSTSDFIRLIRLNKARKLLKSKKYNISEIAIMVGFSDAKYFSTTFKKQFGKSPSKFANDN